MNNLKACPFCGSEDIIIERNVKRYEYGTYWENYHEDQGIYIRCKECSCRTRAHGVYSTFDYDQIKESKEMQAIEEWNNRIPIEEYESKANLEWENPNYIKLNRCLYRSCPFCGNDDIYCCEEPWVEEFDNETCFLYIGCTSCYSRTGYFEYSFWKRDSVNTKFMHSQEARSDALKAWNRRPEERRL